jgi:putative transposase
MTFVCEHRDRFGVEPILRVLTIPVSTFYGWVGQQRDPCQRVVDDQALLGRIQAVHARSGGTYGAPRVHAQLRRDGVQTSRKRVARLLGAHGLQGAFLRRKWRCSTRQDPTATPAPDLVNRQFTAPTPNRLWVADLSRIPTGEGPLWLASVRDAYSRRIVGWKTSDRADVELVLGALEYAIWGRGLDGGDGQPRLIHHSDRGAQYTAIRFTQRLADAGIQPSMGSVGDSFDNALAENLLLHPENRADLPHQLPHPRGGRPGPVPLHRRLVQPPPHPEGPWLAQPQRVRDRLPSQPGGCDHRRNQVAHPPENRGNLKQPPHQPLVETLYPNVGEA